MHIAQSVMPVFHGVAKLAKEINMSNVIKHLLLNYGEAHSDLVDLQPRKCPKSCPTKCRSPNARVL